MKSNVLFLVLFLGLSGFAFFADAQEETAPWSKSLEIEKQDMLQVYVHPGSVKLIPTDKNEIVVKTNPLVEEDSSLIKWEVKEKIVKLDFRNDTSTRPTQFEIQIPSTLNLDLNVAGDVTAAAPLGGNLRIITGSGDVDLTDVNGSITASTDSGELYLKNIQGNATLTAKDGDIDVEVVSGDLEINNEDGDSYAKQVVGNVTAKSTDGDITIEDAEGNASLTTASGDVSVEKAVGLTTINTTDGDIDLSAADNSIVIATDEGDISLKKITGPFEVKTETGGVIAEVIPGRTGRGKITSREGDLELYVPESSGVTILANVRDSGSSDKEEDDDAIESDFKPERSDKSGSEIRNEYILNGGGDTILVETVSGSIMIKKLMGNE
jgi:Toastrack DUF4097